MIKIGLTGPTGAGKSTIAAVLEAHGIPVVDADAVARTVTAVGSPVLPQLAETFGQKILQADGSLDRRALAEIAFSSPENTAKLNAITHPAILQKITAALDACSSHPVAVVDAPLLFETALDRLCDHTVAVLADADVRLARILARDGLSPDAIKSRMAAQPSMDFYRARAEYIVENNGTVFSAALAEELLRKIEEWCR